MIYITIILVSIIVLWRIEAMSVGLERIRAEIAENNEVVDSVLVLVSEMAEKIRDNSDDEAALNALADQLDASADKLAAAVASNTSADDEVIAEDLEPIAETLPA